MFRRFIIVAGLLLLLPCVVHAQNDAEDSVLLPPIPEQPAPAAPPQPKHPAVPDISAIPQNVREGEMEYADALRKLTAEQKSDQQALDQNFYVTMLPTMETYDMGGKLIFCLGHKYPGSAISADQQKYAEYFKAFQAEKNVEQESLWQKQRMATMRVGYMDHLLMERHYDYIQAMQKAVAEIKADRAIRTGVYRDTNCADIQKTLDASALHARKAAGNAPESLKPPNKAQKRGTRAKSAQ